MIFKKSLRWQNALILFASYFFYGWWSWGFMILLGVSTLLDYTYGFWVASPNRKKAKLFLWLSIINNLGILGVFKYYNFFAGEIKNGLELLSIHTNPLLLDIMLPVGISFYTFHGMSYVFDIYRNKQKPVSNFIDYAVFVSFFPLLVAGPIERANHLLPQVQKPRTFNYIQLVEGCRLILWGLFKKVIIADSLAIAVDQVYGNYANETGFTLIVAAISFSFQIYCDFSGYSDVALGTAKLFGFELLSNFRFPYFSRDIAEFWRRWHISLSSWFRDYLYIPLGGSKLGKAKAVRNTFIIFIVSGFWHGASWNFILWGTIHAIGFLPLLLLNRNRKHVSEVVAQNRSLPNVRELIQMLATFAFVTFAWIFFRAESLGESVGFIQHLISDIAKNPAQLLSVPRLKTPFISIVLIIAMDWWIRRDERQIRTPKNVYVRWFIYILLLSLVLGEILGNEGENSFIYFQF